MMANLNFKKIETKKVGFYLLLGYLFFLNIFVIRATPEVLALEFLVFAFFVKGLGGTQFIKDWMPYVGLFVLYEFIRGFADDVSPFYYATLYKVHFWELAIFKTLPTTFLQHYLLSNKLLLDISILFYSSFFYYSFVVGFLIWIFSRKNFNDYFTRFMFMSYIGLICYFLFPTAPPWFVSAMMPVDISRPIWEDTVLYSFSGVSVYRYYVTGNLVAAMPSLHSGWTAFTSLYLVSRYGKRWLITFIVPLMVGFSVVLTGEHYLLDVVAGFMLAFICIKLPIGWDFVKWLRDRLRKERATS